MIFDCFISHQHEDLEYVKALSCELEKRGIKCWYAPRNINGRYAKAIAEGISHSKIFLIILNSKSVISDAVLDEVELAHNVAKTSKYASIQPVCIESLDFDNPDYQEMMLFIRRFQFLDVKGMTDFKEIADRVINSQPQLINQSKERTESSYVVQEKEDKRLGIQNELLDLFDHDIYLSLISKYNEPFILDVGCGTGGMFQEKISNKKISAYVGIDRSSKQIEKAKLSGFIDSYFFINDVESVNFEENFEIELHQLGIRKFNIINISMVLLHLKAPIKLLTILKKYLTENGTIIIRDIDDGLNFAYPDEENSFERIYKMCAHDDQSGNRRNGRRIYNDLLKAGYSNIKLERQGLSSIGMSNSQKEAFFNMYFPFALENAKIMLDKNPWNIEFKEDYLWYKDKFYFLKNTFINEDFVFSLGFMLFTATM